MMKVETSNNTDSTVHKLYTCAKNSLILLFVMLMRLSLVVPKLEVSHDVACRQ